MSSHNLEKFLHNNTGQTADWPIRIKVDDTQVADELMNHLIHFSYSVNLARKLLKLKA